MGTVLSIGVLGFTSNTNHVFAVSNGYDKNDDHVNWKRFKNSNTYEDSNKKAQKCFERAYDSGDNLAGDEVKKCEQDSGYRKDCNSDKNKDDGDNGDKGEDSGKSNDSSDTGGGDSN